MIDVFPRSGMIKIGKQGENRATRVILPNTRAGSGSILLLHQRALDKKPYPVPVTESAEGIIWVVAATDTANQGRGQAELQWLGENGEIVKSVTYQTETARSLSAPGAVPDEPMKPYVQAVAKDAQAAKDAAASATEAARIAETSAGQAMVSSDNAAKSLKKLEDGIASGDFRGEIGDKGDKGDPGEKGEKGDHGEVGPAGDTTAADAAAEAANKAAQEAQKAAEVAVLYTEQNLADSQQEQARSNINAADKARQNILVGTEAGNPIAVDNAFSAPLCGLTVYGKSTQDGTPSPDNPVPIVSAGDGGSVAVRVTGKNLLNPALFQNNKYQSFNVETGYYGIDDLSGWWITGIQPCCPNTTYHFSKFLGGGCFYDNEKKVIGVIGFEFSIKTPAKCAYYCANFSEEETHFGSPIIATVSEPTTYSPYREQLLTLPTPNGLPGIPVTSGGNYTDQNGQQWVCDEVDLERGVKVQRIASFVIDAKNANNISIMNPYTNVAVVTSARLNTPQETRSKDRSDRCVLFEVLPWMYNTWASTVNAVGYVEDNCVDFAIESSYLGLSEASTVDERKTALVKYFTDKPCQVVYKIAHPIETPLTPAEISAYKALTAYAPDTVVQASDGAGIKLDYQRDVNIVIKNLEDAIASMTTT